MELGRDALAALRRALGAEIVRVTPLSGGYRTANWRLDLATGPALVARRYPPERSVCAVEAALLTKIAGTVPAPEVVLADPAGELTGAPLLVTTFVEGVPASRAVAEAGAVGRIARAAGTTLAAVGAHTFPAAGFFTGPDLAVDPLPGGAGPLVAWAAGHLERAVALDAGLRTAWLRLVERAAPVVDAVPPGRSLVHSDYNPKNLLVARDGEHWRVTAVLDWEFAYAGHPCADVGNWLRFAETRPPAYAEEFVAGFRAAGGLLPPQWPLLARVLDALAVAEFLSRGPGHAYYDRAAALVRAAVERGAV